MEFGRKVGLLKLRSQIYNNRNKHADYDRNKSMLKNETIKKNII